MNKKDKKIVLASFHLITGFRGTIIPGRASNPEAARRKPAGVHAWKFSKIQQDWSYQSSFSIQGKLEDVDANWANQFAQKIGLEIVVLPHFLSC